MTKQPSGSKLRGVIPGVASFLVPGAGQLINGETDKAIGVFFTWAICGLSLIGGLPLIGGIATAIAALTHIYAVADGYLTARSKRA